MIGIFSSAHSKFNLAFSIAIFIVRLEFKLFSSANFWIRSICSCVVASEIICEITFRICFFDSSLKMSHQIMYSLFAFEIISSHDLTYNLAISSYLSTTKSSKSWTFCRCFNIEVNAVTLSCNRISLERIKFKYF